MKDKKVTPTQKALNLWAVILIVWSIYRTYFKLPEWFDEFIAKPLVFVLPVLVYIRSVEKKEILSSLFINKNFKSFIKEFFISFGVGLILLLTALIFNFLLRFLIPASPTALSSDYQENYAFVPGQFISQEISRGYLGDYLK